MDNKENQNYGIFVHEKDGQKWVRVKVYGHDFLLALHDIEINGNTNFNWEEACDAAKSLGYTLPSKKQWELVEVYRDEIEKVIVENGGARFSGVYWSVARFYSYHAWFYSSGCGRLIYYDLSNGLTARPLAYPN